jgi:hypothetical protein
MNETLYGTRFDVMEKYENLPRVALSIILSIFVKSFQIL